MFAAVSPFHEELNRAANDQPKSYGAANAAKIKIHIHFKTPFNDPQVSCYLRSIICCPSRFLLSAALPLFEQLLLQYLRSCPYSLVAINCLPHCGQIHVRAVFFQFAGFGCLWFQAVRHLSEQNFFRRPLLFCENSPPQFGQMSTYSSSRITSSYMVSASLHDYQLSVRESSTSFSLFTILQLNCRYFFILRRIANLTC